MADIPDSAKMEVTRTSRGFAVARGVDRYEAPYSIQDSSLAEEAAIWLGSDADTAGRAHLTQDMAASLIPLLQAFVATGSIAGSADTIAAPPVMDREAVETAAKAMAEAAKVGPWERMHEKAPRGWGETACKSYWRDMANIALSTLSADAIRQGEWLRALSDRATPGPWAWEQCGEMEDVPVVGIAFPGDDPDCKAPYEGEFRDSDANRMTIAFDWQSCDGHSPSANAAFAVAAVNFVRKLIATPASHASDGGKA